MNICSKTSRFRIALIKNLFGKSELVRFYVGKYMLTYLTFIAQKGVKRSCLKANKSQKNISFMDWLKSGTWSTGLDKSLGVGSWSLRRCTITMVDHILW